MIVYTNSKGEIKDVNFTSNDSLIALEINDETNPFKGWSFAKICCYKVTVSDGIVTMMTPYVDNNFIEHIDMLGKSSEHYLESKTAYIYDTECTFEIDREGIVTCSCVTESGKGIPCTYEVINKTIKVSFDPLEEVATVRVNIQ